MGQTESSGQDSFDENFKVLLAIMFVKFTAQKTMLPAVPSCVNTKTKSVGA
jgi:hypothetical protein